MYDFEEQKQRNIQRAKEDIRLKLSRKCGMCGEYKNIAEFKMKNRRYRKSGTYNSYCRNCQKLYMKEYMRIYRERTKTK